MNVFVFGFEFFEVCLFLFLEFFKHNEAMAKIMGKLIIKIIYTSRSILFLHDRLGKRKEI